MLQKEMTLEIDALFGARFTPSVFQPDTAGRCLAETPRVSRIKNWFFRSM